MFWPEIILAMTYIKNLWSMRALKEAISLIKKQEGIFIEKIFCPDLVAQSKSDLSIYQIAYPLASSFIDQSQSI